MFIITFPCVEVIVEKSVRGGFVNTKDLCDCDTSCPNCLPERIVLLDLFVEVHVEVHVAAWGGVLISFPLPPWLPSCGSCALESLRLYFAHNLRSHVLKSPQLLEV